MQLNLQPNLADNLVKLRPLHENDFEATYAAANDPKIWEQHPCKRNEKAEFEKFFAESIASKGALAIIDVKTNELIGSSRYKLVAGFDSGVEVGWTFLSRNYWGGTYNKAVKELMIQYAFQYFDYVFLIIAIENIRSQMAARKIGAYKIDANELPGLEDPGPEKLIFAITKK